MTAHINRLKPWNAPDASILRVVVADEEAEVEEKKEPDWRSLLEPQQHADIEQILVDYKSQTDGTLGEGVIFLGKTAHTLYVCKVGSRHGIIN